MTKAARYIGGSILPPSNPQILEPIDCPFGQLQVLALPTLDTHVLVLRTELGEFRLAEHPNGYSCHVLADAMAKGDERKVREQVDYIVACGGIAGVDATEYRARRKERVMAYLTKRAGRKQVRTGM